MTQLAFESGLFISLLLLVFTFLCSFVISFSFSDEFNVKARAFIIAIIGIISLFGYFIFLSPIIGKVAEINGVNANIQSYKYKLAIETENTLTDLKDEYYSMNEQEQKQIQKDIDRIDYELLKISLKNNLHIEGKENYVGFAYDVVKNAYFLPIIVPIGVITLLSIICTLLAKNYRFFTYKRNDIGAIERELKDKQGTLAMIQRQIKESNIRLEESRRIEKAWKEQELKARREKGAYTELLQKKADIEKQLQKSEQEYIELERRKAEKEKEIEELQSKKDLTVNEEDFF